MPYTYTSFLTAKSQLAARLGNNVFWNDTELGLYIIEGLRTWNAFASYWREEFLLDAVINTVWYDLSNILTIPNTLRAFTVLDTELYNLIEDHLLEPPTGAVWSGSLQFNAQDMIQAVQRRRDEVLSATGCTITRKLVNAASGVNSTRTQLDDKTIDIRRIAWIPVPSPAVYTNVPLWPDDVWGQQSYERDFTTQAPGSPSTYRQSTEPPLSFDTDISPAVPGQYEVLSVDAGPNLDSTVPQTLSVPDDFAWLVKFGALGDLLNREANAKDSLRAGYCNARFAQGMALLKSSPAVLAARINNLPLDMDSVQNTDDYRPNWQAESTTRPDTLITAGLNLIGLVPTPDTGPYSISLSVVRNAPIPTNDADFIQLGRDEYDALLDYCVHLAAFKMGGAEFLATIPLFQRFIKQAGLYNAKLNELGEYMKAIYDLSKLQEMSNPVMAQDTLDAMVEGN